MKRFLSFCLVIFLPVGLIGCAARRSVPESRIPPQKPAQIRVGVLEGEHFIYSTGVGQSKNVSKAKTIARDHAQAALTTYVRTHFPWVEATKDMGSQVAYYDLPDPEPDSQIHTAYVIVRMLKPGKSATRSPRVTSRPVARTRIGVWEEQGFVYATGLGRAQKCSQARKIARENAQRALTTYVRTHFPWVEATKHMGSDPVYRERQDPKTDICTVYATVKMQKPEKPASR